MAPKIIALIQARMGSTRLPGKVALPLGGSTVLEQVVSRVQSADKIDETIVITTFSHKDLELVNMCSRMGIRVFCGSEDDVLDRYYQAAKLIEPEHVIRITADCPLMDPSVIDLVIDRHLESGADYTSNVLEETYPDGLDVEIFKFSVLKEAWKEASIKSDREHVTLYIRNRSTHFQLESVKNNIDLSHCRWTLDEERDYDFIKSVYSHLAKEKNLGMDNVLDLLRNNPLLSGINNEIIRNEGLLKSLREDGEKDE